MFFYINGTSISEGPFSIYHTSGTSEGPFSIYHTSGTSGLMASLFGFLHRFWNSFLDKNLRKIRTLNIYDYDIFRKQMSAWEKIMTFVIVSTYLHIAY